MIFDRNKFESNSRAILFYAKEIAVLKKEISEIFKKNKNEIIKCKTEMLDITDRIAEKEYLSLHPIINEFNTKKALVDVLENIINKIKLNTSCFEPNRRIILTCNNDYSRKYLYDLENDECVNISNYSIRDKEYLKYGLERVNSLVGEFSLSDTFVMKNIYFDYKKISDDFTNRDLYNEYNKARRYDNSCKKQVIDINQKLIELNNDLCNNKIDKDTFDLRMQMLKIIESDNLDNLYLNYISFSDKSSFVDAYYELSSSEDNYLNMKVRTRSPIINMAVLYRKHNDK